MTHAKRALNLAPAYMQDFVAVLPHAGSVHGARNTSCREKSFASNLHRKPARRGVEPLANRLAGVPPGQATILS